MSLNPFTETQLNLFKTNWQIDTAFDTLALEDGAGREQRFCRITESLTSINADGMLLNADEFNYLKAFFDARNGKYEGFRFKNELDYTLTQSPEYYLSDTTVYQQGILVQKSGLTYQILKRYHVNGTNTYKTIKKPVNGTVKVYSNGVELTSGWSVNINTGIVTFGSTPSGTLTVSCEYDLLMRFDMDEDQLNHRVVENDSNFHSASDVYQVLQFALIEDSYDKFNNYVASDFDDIDYDFIPDPLPEITKGTFTVTRIKTTQSKKEKRAIQSSGKASRKLGQNGLLDKELKAIYTLFMVAKGRKCAFNYSGQSYRFDSDVFKCTFRSFGWDFAGIDLKQSIVHEVPKINTLCHCIKIKVNRQLKYNRLQINSRYLDYFDSWTAWSGWRWARYYDGSAINTPNPIISKNTGSQVVFSPRDPVYPNVVGYTFGGDKIEDAWFQNFFNPPYDRSPTAVEAEYYLVTHCVSQDSLTVIVDNATFVSLTDVDGNTFTQGVDYNMAQSSTDIVITRIDGGSISDLARKSDFFPDYYDYIVNFTVA